MILNNFAKVLFNSVTDAVGAITLIDGSTLSKESCFYYVNSNIQAYSYQGGNAIVSKTVYAYNNYSLTFGSGTTEPTADDYQMESPYDTTDHFKWASISQSYVLDNLTKIIVGAISNISEEDLIVSEIGVVVGAGTHSTAGGYSSDGGNDLLIARSLITPVTIAPNETKTFQYTLDLSGIAG